MRAQLVGRWAAYSKDGDMIGGDLPGLKDEDTPVMVEKVVSDIDEVVLAIRFDGWQNTREGDRDVRRVLRQTLWIKYKMRDQEVYDRAYEYIREYY